MATENRKYHGCPGFPNISSAHALVALAMRGSTDVIEKTVVKSAVVWKRDGTYTFFKHARSQPAP
jgi:hypothetical protein